MSAIGTTSLNTALRGAPLGLIEIDDGGTVRLHKPEQRDGASPPMPSIVGRNLFTDVVPAANGGEFRDRLDGFKSSRAQAGSFNITFSFGHDRLPVRVLLARMYDRTEDGGTQFTLIHIRRT